MDEFLLLKRIESAVSRDITVGKYPYVFDLDDLVVKAHRNEIEAFTEFSFGTYVKARGGSVPEMKDIFKADEMSLQSPFENGWYVVMEKAPGKTLNLLNEQELELAEVQWRKEIMKILDMGVQPYQSGAEIFYMENSLYDGNSDRLTLIDLECWKRTPVSELQYLKKMVLNMSIPWI